MTSTERCRIPVVMVCLFVLTVFSHLTAQRILNTDHLTHLTRQCTVEGKPASAIQIYAEYPDYRWVGDSDEGDMCVDDAARALVFYCRHLNADTSASVIKTISQLTAFITAMQAENGYFYNFIFSDGSINREHQNSKAEASFWSWRAFWALSEVLLLESKILDEEKNAARSSIEKLLPNLTDICVNQAAMEKTNGINIPTCIARLGGDQAGILLTALCNYVASTPNTHKTYDSSIRRIGDALLFTQQGSERIFPYFAFMSWKHIWHAWGNIQSYALMRVSDVTGDERYRKAAINEVSHFYPYIIENGYMESFFLMGLPEGNQTIESIQVFPQIAYGIRPMVFASVEAYRFTKNKKYLQTAIDLTSWLFGKNPAGKIMYDKETGRVFDGIQNSRSVNVNAGAESTIEGLLILQKLASLPEGKKWLEEILNNSHKKF
jgi:hypothetical protein